MTVEAAQKRLEEAEQEARSALDVFKAARERLNEANRKRDVAQREVISALQADLDKAKVKA